jgi:hypothetical protein
MKDIRQMLQMIDNKYKLIEKNLIKLKASTMKNIKMQRYKLKQKHSQ